MNGDEADGVPTPASAPMDYETARGVVERTKGQFQMMPAQRDGQWYLYLVKAPPDDDE